MKLAVVPVLLIFTVVYSYCGIDFKSIGRYTWHCNSKLNNQDEGDQDNNTVEYNSINKHTPEVQVSNASFTNCDMFYVPSGNH